MKDTFFALFLIQTSLVFSNSIIPGSERLPETDPARNITILSEMACLNCHQAENLDINSKKGPQLNDLNNRIRKDWLVKFLTDPQKTKPGTTMPNLFINDPDASKKIMALSHFLLSDQQPKEKLKKTPRLNQRSFGKTLYHNLGCVACHGADPIENPSLTSSLKPLGQLKEKYSLASLTRFLDDPLKYRKSGRMPDLNLNTDDASHIAAYLLNRKEMNSYLNPGDLKKFKTEQKLIKQGKQLFEKMGCANCHEKTNTTSKSNFIAWNHLDFKKEGCLNPKNGLDFALSDKQKQALRKVDLNSIKEPQIKLRHTFASLNCYACHSRNDIGGPLDITNEFFHGEESLGDEGRLPPKLKETGRKFKTSWIEKVLAGKGNTRPSMKTQMPIFGHQNTHHLPELFKSLDLPHEEAKIKDLEGGNPEVGRILLGSQGMNCIMCHNFKKRNSTGIPGLNFAYAPERYNPIWFKENLIKPNVLRPGTLMPSFWPHGKSTQAGILNGNTDLQIASIWEYLKLSEGYPEGYPPPRNKFEIHPGDKPVVMRTFMQQAGKYSIVVGTQQKIHFSYDSKKMILSQVWKGRFLDGYNTWYNRFAPFEKPLGEIQSTLPAHTLFLDQATQPWPNKAPSDMGYQFKGYQLNKEGFPIFITDYKQYRIEETFTPNQQSNGIIRSIKIESKHKNLWFNPYIKKKKIKVITPNLEYKNGLAKLHLKHEEIKLELEYTWEK
jgi:cbb3-type cytochrome oxidase cytochrome c subunit